MSIESKRGRKRRKEKRKTRFITWEKLISLLELFSIVVYYYLLLCLCC